MLELKRARSGLASGSDSAPGGQDLDLHGEADAGAQKAAAARTTARAAADTFMVPVDRSCGRSCAVSESSARIFCSSGPALYREASRGGRPQGEFPKQQPCTG